jgi:hypothetical protein
MIAMMFCLRMGYAYSGLTLSALMPYLAMASATLDTGNLPSSASDFQCGHHDEVAVHLEVLAQLAAEVAAAKTVGAQHFVGAALAGMNGRICSA